MNKRTNEQITNRQAHKQTNSQKDKHTKRTNGQAHKQTNTQMDKRTNAPNCRPRQTRETPLQKISQERPTEEQKKSKRQLIFFLHLHIFKK